MGNLEMSQTSIYDHRKFAVWVILAPYLIDVHSRRYVYQWKLKSSDLVYFERTPHIVITNLLGKTVLVILSLAIITTLGTGQISRADQIHCDRTGYPSCYSVGFSDGLCLEVLILILEFRKYYNTQFPKVYK